MVVKVIDMTNGDKLRHMSNLELAEYIVFKCPATSCYFCERRKNNPCDGNCVEGIQTFLDSEAEEVTR